MRKTTVTESELNSYLNSYRKLFGEYAQEHNWSQQIPLADAVLIATDPARLVDYIRDRMGPETLRDDFLFLDAAHKLAEYHRYYIMALPYASLGEAVPSVLVTSLEQKAAQFYAAIGRIGQFQSA
jgi:hypothetical protein